jgi:hypothetical protein
MRFPFLFLTWGTPLHSTDAGRRVFSATGV